jgi:flavodoxin
MGENKKMKNRVNLTTNESEVLIAYYSLQGNTRRVAECIQSLCDGNLHEMKLLKPYSLAGSYTLGIIHTRTGHSPILKEHIDLREYKTIIIGSPVWAYTFAPPIRSFIADNSFVGKKVAFFCTHGGNLGHYFDKAKELCTDVEFLEGHDFFMVSKISDEALRDKTEDWLKSIGIL